MNVLILGDGLLGAEITSQTGWDFLSRKQNSLNINQFEKYITKEYDIIVNCIANTDTYSKNKNSHWNVNCVFVDKLIDFCNVNNIKLIHISTDYIYANSKDYASENDIPIHSGNWYSYTKLISDGLVQLRSKDYLLIRCSHKPYPFPYDSAWGDQKGNFDYVNVISDLIVKLINIGAKGVYNVGTEHKTMYDLAIKTREVFNINSPRYVPKNITMNINKLKEKLK